MTEFVPHSDKQDRAIFSESRILLCGTGIQWGKTRVGAVRMKVAMHTHTDPEDTFIIASPNYKTMEQSTLPAFRLLMGDIWDKNYSAQRAEFKMPGGGVCYFRTATDPDSVVGITNVRHIWGDEAGKFGLYFWENLQARSSFRQCPIDLTTSPYALNWIFKEIIRPKSKDASARPDVELIQATSAENPYFPAAEYEKKRMTMDPRRFNAIYGGKWEKMSGLVYSAFDDIENVCEPCTLPTGTQYFGGIDWGFTAPFVLTVRAITPTNKHFQVFEFYKSGLTLAQKIEVARQAKAVFGVKMFYCDPEDPSSIQSFNEAKLPSIAADNDIKSGIDDHFEIVKTRDYKIFRGTSPYTIDEYESYHYPDEDDIGPDDDVKEMKPVKQHDHAMDSNRYISRMTRRGMTKRKPKSPDEQKQEDQYQRLERLKRKSREGSEKWTA